MISFQVSVNDDGSSSRAGAMTAVIMETVIPAIKTKAQQLFIECNTDVDIVLEAAPYADT
jgi:hypothetical protein